MFVYETKVMTHIKVMKVNLRRKCRMLQYNRSNQVDLQLEVLVRILAYMPIKILICESEAFVFLNVHGFTHVPRYVNIPFSHA